MSLQTMQIITLLTVLALLLSQLMVAKKQTSHILYAVFCGSIAMTLTKELSSEAVGAYKYIIGMGACATCNGYWLLSRSLFRNKNAISVQHILLAAAIAFLILINQGYWFVQSSNLMGAVENSTLRYFIEEITILLSSCILVLTIWEACRNFNSGDKQDKAQRIFFILTFATAVITSKVSRGVFAGNPEIIQMITTAIIFAIIVNTQILLIWRTKTQAAVKAIALTQREQEQATQTTQEIAKPNLQMAISEQTCMGEAVITDITNNDNSNNEAKPVDESILAAKIKALLVDNSLFLQANLKVADVARQLDVPEYRVSNALRHNLNARNFNHYVNELRIKHAQTLLADADKQKWSVLVVALESGFASVGPFTRAFKAATGFTPNQYRKSLDSAC